MPVLIVHNYRPVYHCLERHGLGAAFQGWEPAYEQMRAISSLFAS
jgi:hypothetical protein